MIKGGVSEPRNKAIMKMFNLIHIGERAGSGVPDIFSAWAEAGWIPPTVEELYNPDRTIMSLSFEEKQAEKTGGNGKQAEKTGGNGKQAETENRRKKQAEKTGGNGKQAETKIK